MGKSAKLTKRGITLIEVTISMAVIIIVTIASLSIIFSSTVNSNKAIQKTSAHLFAADTIEAFRTSDTVAEYERAMEFRGGFESKDKSEENNLKNVLYYYNVDESPYDAIIQVDFVSGKITVSIGDETSGNVVSLEFTKYVKGGS